MPIDLAHKIEMFFSVGSIICILFTQLNFIGSIASEPVDYITCGSVIKLKNDAQPGIRLHSHDINYRSGSQQQSVTGVENQDLNSYWSILGELNKACDRGSPIECGSIIRLQHIHTRRYLHSHLFKSPLSSQQEVSAFGDDNNSDTGDHWMVFCKTEYWQKGESVRLKHVDTGMWLSLSGQMYGRPIYGQLEVVCSSGTDGTSYWRSAEGIYVQPMESSGGGIPTHDEL